MKKFKFLEILILMAVLPLLNLGCSNPAGADNGGGQTSLDGRWERITGSGDYIVFSNGTFIRIGGVPYPTKGTYEISGDQIIFHNTQTTTDGGITWYGGAIGLVIPANETGTYTLEGNQLTIVMPGLLGSTISYVKVVPLNPQAAVLSENQWKHDEISAASAGEKWFKFNVTSGTYRIWLNGSGSNGDGSKSLDARVRAFYSNGSPIFSDNTAWINPRTLTANANGTVYLRVSPGTQGGTGTFGIVYSTGTARPAGSFSPPSSVMLTINKWENDSLTNAADIKWYSFNASAGTYYVFLNGSGGNGDGTKTLDARVRAYSSDGTQLFTNNTSWSTVRSLSVSSQDTIYLCVSSYNNSTGTYGISYSGSSAIPSGYFNPPSPIALLDRVWMDGAIESTAPGTALWYSFNVQPGTQYRIWMNRAGNSSNGDGTKNLAANMNIYFDDGTAVFTNPANTWGTPVSVTTGASTSKVYIRVTPGTAGATGTFGLVYTSDTYRPLNLPSSGIIPLSDGVWVNGETTSEKPVAWYSVNVSAGVTYRFWANISSSNTNWGDGTVTLSATVELFSSDGLKQNYSSINLAGSVGGPHVQNATANETLYLKVTPNTPGSTGTFAVLYSTGTLRPLNLPSNVTTLTPNEWTNGEITSAERAAWYKFDVVNGQSYTIWLDTSDRISTGTWGSGTKTLVGLPDIYYSDGTILRETYPADSSWNTGFGFTANRTSTIYVRVRGQYSSDTGTFGVAYNNNGVRPAVQTN